MATGSSFVVAPMFERLFEGLLRSSATLRRQHDQIAGTPRLRVSIEPLFGRPVDRLAQTEFRRSASGWLQARVAIATPLTTSEYAEMLAHEFEHILEQIEGVDLGGAAGDGSGVARLIDGAYETERARRAGREAASEVVQAK